MTEKKFEIPAILSCTMRKSRAGKFNIIYIPIYIILNLPALDFLVGKIKEWEFANLSVVLYPIFIHTISGKSS